MILNSQLLTLLERTPMITDEDRHNISVVFHALSSERQCYILDNWEECATRFISERERLDRAQEQELVAMLSYANTVLDAAILRQQEQVEQKKQKTEQIRRELESTVAYSQMDKMRKIRAIAKTHS